MATALSRTGWQLFGFMAAEGMGETFYFPASMSLVSGLPRQGDPFAGDGASTRRASTWVRF